MEKRSIGSIRKEQDAKMSELFKRVGLFFAFSDKQFEENKTPLKEGEKYVSIGYGGYLPNGNVGDFDAGLAEINKWHDDEIEANGLVDAEILYELRNHECYYTGDIEDVLELFAGRHTPEKIVEVFRSHLE